ncbi:MAG: hypothetical protein GX154_04000 [Clostridiales bacterium]|nr:hypothetical protein [Clostridiales bacterium]
MEFTFPTTPQEAGNGRLITFIPLRVGAGASTLACMTAYAASPVMSTSLIDFTPESKIRSYLGYHGDISSASILDINSIVNYGAIFTASEEHHMDIKVFPGIPAGQILAGNQIDTHLVLKAVKALKSASPLTIAVSGPLHQTGWLLAMLSDVICVVGKPSRTDMDAFQPVMDFLNRLDCSARIKIILNQNKYPGSMSAKATERFYRPDIIVDYNEKVALSANKREVYSDVKISKILFPLIKGE